MFQGNSPVSPPDTSRWSASRQTLSPEQQKKHCPEAAMKVHSLNNVMPPKVELAGCGTLPFPHISARTLNGPFSLKPRPHQEVGKRIKIM